MSPRALLYIGGAGTGKTTQILNTMDDWIHKKGLSPFRIGFVSFTRAARIEAAERAGAKFNVDPDQLTGSGWFRTLHSCCYRLTGTKGESLLSDTKESKDWISAKLGEDVGDVDEDTGDTYANKSKTGIALAIWTAARNRLGTLEDEWRQCHECDSRTPSWEFVFETVEKYEKEKWKDDRMDFTDLLAKYAGKSFSVDGASDVLPIGEVPNLDVWFLDEAQDNSALTDAVARRLTSESQWVYCCGDPFQSIYGFAGSDPSHFQSWEYENKKILDQTHRCPAPVLEFGESVLKGCSDYWDRKIKPAAHSGSVKKMKLSDGWADDLEADTDVLILARTNWLTKKIVKRLDERDLPWTGTKGRGSKWDSPVRNKAIKCLFDLAEGDVVDAESFGCVIRQIKVKENGVTLLERGAKKRWSDEPPKPHELATLDTLSDWGATDDFKELIASGRWWGADQLIKRATDIVTAFRKYGAHVVMNPKIRVGTIHSAKGMQASRVILLTTTSPQVEAQAQSERGMDEELRLQYVGATRSSEELIILIDESASCRWDGELWEL